MSRSNPPTGRRVHLHAFVSVKGGVGKSALAVAAALALEERGRCALVVDADLTGTSLADGLALEAPDLKSTEGLLDLLESAPGFLDRTETLARRDARNRAPAAPGEPTQVPFLNDLLLADGPPYPRLDTLAWRHEARHELRIVPSSPLRPDVANALTWLYDESQQSAWIVRLADLLAATASSSDVTDIILDLPPGLFGFARKVLALMAHLSQDAEGWPEALPDLPGQAHWTVNPVLVTTADRNDLFCAMEAYFGLSRELPELRPIVNRTGLARSEVARAIEERFSTPRMDRAFDLVSSHASSLGRLFRTGVLELDEAVSRELVRALRLGEAAP